MALTKFSILAMYWRIFPEGFVVVRRGCIALSVMSMAWFVASSIVTSIQCKPLRRLWTIGVPGTCFDAGRVAIGNAIPNISIDLAILLLPVYEISRLPMALAQKLAIAAIFLLGLL